MKNAAEQYNELILLAGNLNSSYLVQQGKYFDYVYGDIENDKVINKIVEFAKVSQVQVALKGGKIGLIGYRPIGFYTSNHSEVLLSNYFKSHIEYVSLLELKERSKSISAKDSKIWIDKIRKNVINSKIDAKILKSIGNVTATLNEICKEKKLEIVGLRTWPEDMRYFGIPFDTVISLLLDEGIMCSCEADVYGALTMWLGYRFGGTAPFFADLIGVYEEDNTALFWHNSNVSITLASKRPVSIKKEGFFLARRQGHVHALRLNVPGRLRVKHIERLRIPRVLRYHGKRGQVATARGLVFYGNLDAGGYHGND